MLSAFEKLQKTRIQLMKDNPFFSYLSMHLDFKEAEIETIGIDANGTLYYNPKYVKSLSISNLIAVLVHEICHLFLNHMERGIHKEHYIFNIATDIVINDIITANGFNLPESTLKPNKHEITIAGVKIKDTNKKTAEEVYNQLIKKAKIINVTCICGKCKTKDGKTSGKTCKGFDKHIYGKQKGDKNKQKNWKKITSEASAMARQRGKMPDGLERVIDTLLNPKLDWRSILHRHITNQIPSDYSWSRQSKRSLATGFYMPSVVKENLDIVVSVDTSGSISQKELTQFLSEIIGISKSFSSVSMTLIICDCKIHDVIEISNGNIEKIMNLKIKGGGGTDHHPVFSHIEKNMPNAKILVSLTDGYTSVGDVTINTLWVICEGGTDEEVKDKGTVVFM